jgi:hypothetical protein
MNVSVLCSYAAIADQSTTTRTSPLQPLLNLPLLTCTRSMGTIRLAKYAKVSLALNLDLGRPFVRARTMNIGLKFLGRKRTQWFDDSSEDIRSCCGEALQTLRTQYGWEVRKIRFIT